MCLNKTSLRSCEELDDQISSNLALEIDSNIGNTMQCLVDGDTNPYVRFISTL